MKSLAKFLLLGCIVFGVARTAVGQVYLCNKVHLTYNNVEGAINDLVKTQNCLYDSIQNLETPQPNRAAIDAESRRIQDEADLDTAKAQIEVLQRLVRELQDQVSTLQDIVVSQQPRVPSHRAPQKPDAGKPKAPADKPTPGKLAQPASKPSSPAKWRRHVDPNSAKRHALLSAA